MVCLDRHYRLDHITVDSSTGNQMADVAENALFTDPVTAISQGKRHLLVRDYGMAVTALAQACELLAQKYGETADELAEPYLLYGRALLALAREETEVLGGAVPGSDEVEAEDEVDEDDNNVNEEKEDDNETDDEENGVKKSNGAATHAEKVTLTNNEANTKTDTTPKAKGDSLTEAKVETQTKTTSEATKNSVAPSKEESTTGVDKDKTANKDETKVPSTSEDSKKDVEHNEKAKVADKKPDSTESKEKIVSSETPSASTSSDKEVSKVTQNGEASINEDEEGEDVSKDEDDDDINNLQLAWEVLESGKLILLKRGPPGWKHLAEAHRLLGEVAMESGNQQGALTDLQACLDLLAKIEPCDPRAIAETYYQLGLAYSLANEFDSSIEQFNEATSLLQAHIQQLEESKDSHKKDDPFYTVEGEIKELKELLPEIQEKIADMKDFKEEACKAMVEGIKSKVAADCLNGAGPSGDGASSSAESTSTNQAKPASDISHLVRKKRKADESDKLEIETPSKKPTS
ncbi:histone-binding protein N1/N2 isoform X1 [Neodiprion lecontei]|uniref:Histone-binding protein N1/N2 isoform X1 n=2 Tax=Neodiprion lecontei TaxID=441921 RepID=A0A6J0BQP7_NEOLC|nr:histone-binding protein N1/N2 isoform X1 [Neodiprion lecontei]